MARRPQGLLPGMEDDGTPALPTQVTLPTLHARLTRRVAQQGQQRSLGREDERREGVGQGQDQGERGPWQERGFAVLHPWDLGERLTRGAVTSATGMIRVPLNPAAGTAVRRARRAAAVRRSLAVVPHVLRYGGTVW
jgi:hypothetical protein